MTNLSKFYEVLNKTEMSSEDRSKIIDAACELANAEMRKGNEIALKVFRK